MAIGLFQNSRSLFFQMDCDIYYATETQDKYGKIVKQWQFDMVEPCSFYTLGDKSNTNNLTFEDKHFFKMETMLFGRFQSDPRQANDGTFHPISHILVTNIRGATCNTETFFIETNGDYVGKPTIYEIKTCQPFIGPFNTVEYYKIQLERTDTQEMRDSVYR
jgi:hypothetical protein